MTGQPAYKCLSCNNMITIPNSYCSECSDTPSGENTTFKQIRKSALILAEKNRKLRNLIIYMANCWNCSETDKRVCRACFRKPDNPGKKDKWRLKK